MKYIFPILLVTLLVSACTGGASLDTSTGEVVSVTPTAQESSDSDGYALGLEYAPKVIEKNDGFRSCIKQSIDQCQEVTFSRMVVEATDTSLCDGFEDETLARRCNDMIYSSLAQKDRDISLCKNVVNGTNECEYSVTLMTAMGSGTIDPCMTLSSSASGAVYTSQDRCILSVVDVYSMQDTTPFDASVCEKISSSDMQTLCQKSFENRAQFLEAKSNVQ